MRNIFLAIMSVVASLRTAGSIFALATVAALSGAETAAYGEDVCIVLSSDAPPFREAQAGAERFLASQGRSTRTVLLHEFDELSLHAVIGSGAGEFVAVGTEAAYWLHATLPASVTLVYCMVSTPPGTTSSPGEAGGSGGAADRATHGVSMNVPIRAQYELIAEALPSARTVGMLYSAVTPRSLAQMNEARAALPRGWKLEAVSVDNYDSVAEAIDALLRRRIDVVWTQGDSSVYNNASVRTLLLGSIRREIPVFGFSASFVRAGALIGVSINPGAQGEHAADLLHRVSRARTGGRGGAEASIHEDPTFEVAVNLIVAQNLSIRLSNDLVRRAARVYRPE